MTTRNTFIALTIALAMVAFPAFYANAAGTINLSLSQQFDAQGKPLSGCKLYFYEAGTTTPQNAYSDTDLSIALPNPLECDASGRLQQFFLADGSIKVRLTDKNGVTILAADGLLVIGASSGGGGGSPVDATTVHQTGDVKIRYGTGAHSGWVRANGRTIGSATSGATERANADCQALFEYLWTEDANLTVSGGRGVSANADWTANKTITLIDSRGRTIAGMDDMGSTAASRLTATYFGAAATVLGAAGGSEFFVIAQANLPAVTLTTTIAAGQGAHAHGYRRSSELNFAGGSSGLGNSGGFNSTTDAATLPAMTGTTPLGGSGTALSRLQPTMVMTIYLKL